MIHPRNIDSTTDPSNMTNSTADAAQSSPPVSSPIRAVNIPSAKGSSLGQISEQIKFLAKVIPQLARSEQERHNYDADLAARSLGISSKDFAPTNEDERKAFEDTIFSIFSELDQMKEDTLAFQTPLRSLAEFQSNVSKLEKELEQLDKNISGALDTQSNIQNIFSRIIGTPKPVALSVETKDSILNPKKEMVNSLKKEIEILKTLVQIEIQAKDTFRKEKTVIIQDKSLLKKNENTLKKEQRLADESLLIRASASPKSAEVDSLSKTINIENVSYKIPTQFFLDFDRLVSIDGERIALPEYISSADEIRRTKMNVIEQIIINLSNEGISPSTIEKMMFTANQAITGDMLTLATSLSKDEYTNNEILLHADLSTQFLNITPMSEGRLNIQISFQYNVLDTSSLKVLGAGAVSLVADLPGSESVMTIISSKTNKNG